MERARAPWAQTAVWLACTAPLLLAARLTSGVNHWVATETAGIVAKADYPFDATRANAPHLIEFLMHERKLQAFRKSTLEFDKALFGLVSRSERIQPLPDLLSTRVDYDQNITGNELSPLPTSCTLLAHKDVRIRDVVDMDVDLTGDETSAEPRCGSPASFSLSLYAHLPGVAGASSLRAEPEPALGQAAWNAAELGRERTNAEMGPRLARGLARNGSSWALLNLAAVYWRVRGDATEAVRCLQHALAASPNAVKDTALLQLGNVLANAGSHSDARVVVDLASGTAGRPSYASRYLQGRLKLAGGDEVGALDAFRAAVDAQPELRAAHGMLRALSHRVKAAAAPRRRHFEVNLRTLTMVLPPNQTWEDFAYEIALDPCKGVECPANTECSQANGGCACSEGWVPGEQGCVEEARCRGKTCAGANQECRQGVCVCKPGYVPKPPSAASDGGEETLTSAAECVENPCAFAHCIERAVCDPATRRCACAPPYVQHGAQCVEPSCVGVRCGTTLDNSFCQSGKCYCAVGYHPKRNSTSCVPYLPCENERCPRYSVCDASDGHCRCIEGFRADIGTNRCVRSGAGADAEATPAELGVYEGLWAHITAERPADAPLRMRELVEVGTVLGCCGDDDRDACEDLARLTPTELWAPYNESVVPFDPDSADHGLFLHTEDEGDGGAAAAGSVLEPKCGVTTDEDARVMVRRGFLPFTAHSASVFPNDAGFPPSPLFADLARALVDSDATRERAVGATIASALAKRPSSFVANVAAAWWLGQGSAARARQCALLALRLAGGGDSDATGRDIADSYLVLFSLAFKNGRYDVAATLATVANDTLAGDPMAEWAVTIALGAQGHAELAAMMLAKLEARRDELASQEVAGAIPELAEKLVPTVECAQFLKVVNRAPDLGLREHNDSLAVARAAAASQALIVAREMRVAGVHRDNATAEWEDIEEAEVRLDRAQLRFYLLRNRMLEIDRLVSAVLRLYGPEGKPSKKQKQPGHVARRLMNAAAQQGAAGAGAGADGAAGSANGGGGGGNVDIRRARQGLPSVPSLISAVEDMLEAAHDMAAEADDVGEAITMSPFQDPAWPHPSDCASAMALADIDVAATVPEMFHPDVPDKEEVINLHLPLRRSSDEWGLPHCGPAPKIDPPHSLDHLDSLADPQTLKLKPMKKLFSQLKGAFRNVVDANAGKRDLGKTLTLKEAGERIRAAMAQTKKPSFLYELAGLYWQVRGRAAECVECLKLGYYYAPAKVKDLALLALAAAVHRAGHTSDALSLAQTAIQMAPRHSRNHRMFADLLVALHAQTHRGVEEAAFFYETAYILNKSSPIALERLKAVRCAQKSPK